MQLNCTVVLENPENVGASKISGGCMTGEIIVITQRWKHNVKKNPRYTHMDISLVHWTLLDLSIAFENFFFFNRIK